MSEELALNIPTHENPVAVKEAEAPVAPEAIETKAPESDEPALAPKFAALAKKAKAAQMAQAKLKAERIEIERARKEIEDFNKYKTEAKQNPLKALEAMGIKYDDLVNFVLNGEQPTVDQKLSRVESELERFRREQEERELSKEKAAQEAAERQYQETIDTFKGKITEFVTGNEKFELINLHDAQGLIFDTIEEYFNSSGKIMTIEKASELVEGYLEEQIETTLQKTKKFQSKFAPKKDEPQPQAAKGPSPTLNNTVATSSSAPSFLPPKTEQERIQRALAKLSGA
jgi:hypothetical protein